MIDNNPYLENHLGTNRPPLNMPLNITPAKLTPQLHKKVGVATGLGIVAILGLGPFGLFAAVFICVSAGGMLGMEIGKNIGSGVYDLDTQLDSGRIFYSPENILGAIK